ncbi:MAG: hypothetical protein KAR45_14760, partial [Desulfobacteraceae bacterium]|nr:hypothetical protein [Desulfobacteraceae bacterium]
DPNLTNYYCDEVIMLKNGSVVASGETRATMTDQTLSNVLGDNIQCDVTKRGAFVVTPKQINSRPLHQHQTTNTAEYMEANA